MTDSHFYVDFDLRVWADGDKYVAQVIDSPGGPSKREVLRPPFGQESHELFRLRLEVAVLRAGTFRGGPMSAEEKVLRQFGSQMFQIVFRDATTIAKAYSDSLAFLRARRGEHDGLRIKLTVEPPELAMLPWEYVFDDSDGNSADSYLCLRNQTPLVRYCSGDATSFSIKGPLNILGMIANPGGANPNGEWQDLKVAQERDRIEEAIRSIPDQSMVNLRWVTGERLQDLLEMMQKESWHVFHFIGHGGINSTENPDRSVSREGFIVLGDGRGGAEKVPASNIALALQGRDTMKLAVLNCCDSGNGGDTDSPARALVKRIPAVVAMQYPIPDEAATSFASMFYRSLVSGSSIEKALTLARVLMRQKSSVHWAIPVLFTHTRSDALFRIDPSATTPIAMKQPVYVDANSVTQPSDYELKRQQARTQLRRLFERAS